MVMILYLCYTLYMQIKHRHHKKYKSIQTLLSTYFILVSLLIILLTSLVFSVIQYNTLRGDALENMQHSATSIAQSVDSEITQMSTITLNAAASETLRSTFITYENAELSAFQKNTLRLQLANILTSLKGFDFSVKQLNAYGTESAGYGVGGYNGALPFSAQGQSWYDAATEAGGLLYIADPAKDYLLSDSMNVAEDTVYFSVVRMYYNELNQAVGYIEVKKYYTTVFETALQPESIYDPTVIIYDENGRQLFPLQNEDETFFSYYEYLNDTGENDIYNTVTEEHEHVAYAVSDNNDLVVAVAVSNTSFLTPVWTSLRLILGVFLLIFLLCLALSSYLSRRFSYPLKHIYHFLNQDDDTKFEQIEMADTGVREIDKLRDSLNEDIRAKEAATNSLLIMKEKELQAQMLALQSQMNPHFLYNSLSTIGEMAEEGQTKNVSQMCTDITEILRYISSNREQTVTVEEELELCTLYLGCMQLRYRGELQHRFEVDDDMLEFQIPKLCVQMLLENSIKFMTTKQPPWVITVTVTSRDCRWELTVKDNGPGFQPDTEQGLREQMAEIRKSGILPSLQIRGMGLMNVFIRFYLLYGDTFLFDFGTLPEGGAFISAGGELTEKAQTAKEQKPETQKPEKQKPEGNAP